MKERDALKFIESVEWTFAKTYAKTSPHEYVVLKGDDPRREKAFEFIKYMFSNSVKEKFYGHPQLYCYIGDRKYWVMEKTLDDVLDNSDDILINRTIAETTHKVYE